MLRGLLIAVIVLCYSSPALLWGRIRVPPGDEMVRELAQESQFVFRGKVVQLALSKDQPGFKEGVAFVAVDRWYKGNPQQLDVSNLPVRFGYSSGAFGDGHNCSNLTLDSYWIFFAKPGVGDVLELSHDCEGALSVSSLRAPSVSGDLLAQLESDFRAGLSDSDSAGRLVSIQRLAGLASPVSRDALHDVIAHGTPEESRWALFAAVKTGDPSVMSLVVPVLTSLRHDKPGPYRHPDGNIAVHLRDIHDSKIVPDLIRILDEGGDELVRNCAMYALAELKSPQALETYASHLSDRSDQVRYDSLLGMRYVTNAPACSFTKPEDAPAAELQCKQWWESSGRQEFGNR